MMTKHIVYPRRRWIRNLMQRLSRPAFELISDLEISGKENIPAEGPLIVVANHFSFLDPAALVRSMPPTIEFLGGFQMPNAPLMVTWIPQLWGYLPVYRGSASRGALRAAEELLAQKGMLGVFPEGGSWAQVLRPARPGTAYLAVRTGAKILPVGIDGLTNILVARHWGTRPHVTLNIGKPFGPFHVEGRGRAFRQQVNAIGDEIMWHIAALLPRERRGCYSDDPATRAAALASYVYPWAMTVED